MPDTNSYQREQMIAEARIALDMVQSDPIRAEMLARRIMESDGVSAGSVEGVTATWAAGRAVYEQGRLAPAEQLLRQARRSSSRAGRVDLEGQIRTSLAAVLVERGATQQAFAELDRAESIAEPAEVGRVIKQRSFLFYHLGRFGDSVDEANRAEPYLVDDHDDLGLCRLLINRGIARLGTGALDRAEEDLLACRVLAVRIEQSLIVAAVDQALGAIYVRRGELPLALATYQSAKQQYEALGRPARMVSILEADLAEALAFCGLAAEAVDAARRSQELASSGGNVVHEAEARLRLASALRDIGDHRSAHAEAAAAALMFRGGRRLAWSYTAECVAIGAAARDGASPATLRKLARRAGVLVGLLASVGWSLEAHQARVLAAGLAVDIGATAQALVDLRPVLRSTVASPVLQAEAWLVQARAHVASGRRARARHSLMRGVREAALYQASFGATELRVQVGFVAAGLTELGARLALEGRNPWSVFGWFEERRAAALRSPSVLPPENGELAVALSRLRNLQATRRDSIQHGRALAPGLDNEIASAERTATDLARATVGSGGANLEPIDRSDLCRALGTAVLVIFGESDGELHAVVIRSARARLVHLGPVGPAVRELGFLLSAMRRMFVSDEGSDGSIRAARAVDQSATILDRLLVGPLGLAGEDCILVPTGSLHGVPWGLLPSMTELDHVVAPSATSWWQASTAGPTVETDAIGVIIGPDLGVNPIESEAIVQGYPHVLQAHGPDATAERTLQLIEQCQLVHIAAHGTFRTDNPLFSSLRLVDGPLVLYELQGLRRAAPIVVLPACEAAAMSVSRGDEILGAGAIFLGCGVQSVVAPLSVVPDEPTAVVIAEFHGQLMRGLTTSAALHRTRRAMAVAGATRRVTAGSFVCFGAGVRLDVGVRRSAPA